MHTRQIVATAAAGIAGFAVMAFGLAVISIPNVSKPAIGAASIGGPFTLVDDTGAPVSEHTLAGKPYAMYFGYTFCPEVCPTTLFDLTRWIKELGPEADKFNYVFVTVDPERDTPKSMHAYLASFDKRIRGYTGTLKQIAKIAKEYRVYYKKIPTSDGGYTMDHSSLIYLMGSDDKFVTMIAYQEADASALAKLRNLAALTPSS